jgi:hypothetical protein
MSVTRGRNSLIGQTPGFWVACAAIFLANAVLSSLYGEWLPAALGLVTTGASLVAAAAWYRRPRDCCHVDVAGRRDERLRSTPDFPPPPG